MPRTMRLTLTNGAFKGSTIQKLSVVSADEDDDELEDEDEDEEASDVENATDSLSSGSRVFLRHDHLCPGCFAANIES